MFYQIFYSPQVKRCAIVTFEHTSCLRVAEQLKDLRKLGDIRKVPKPNRMIP